MFDPMSRPGAGHSGGGPAIERMDEARRRRYSATSEGCGPGAGSVEPMALRQDRKTSGLSRRKARDTAAKDRPTRRWPGTAATDFQRSRQLASGCSDREAGTDPRSRAVCPTSGRPSCRVDARESAPGERRRAGSTSCRRTRQRCHRPTRTYSREPTPAEDRAVPEHLRSRAARTKQAASSLLSSGG